MARLVEFEWIDDGFKAIVRSPGALSAVRAAAFVIQRKAGKGHSVGTVNPSRSYGGRAMAFVTTATHEAAVKQAEDNNLSKAVG